MAFHACVILAGLVVGWLRKGSIWAIPNLRLKGLWILPIAYVLQHVSIQYFSGITYELTIVASYLTLLVFGVLNFKVPGLAWAIGGTAANFLVMLVNGLRMPAYVPAVKHLAPEYLPMLQSGHFGKSIAMSNSTHLNFLGDIFSFEIQPVSLISIGDILFAIGLVILLQHSMRAERSVTRSGQQAESPQTT